VNDTYQVRPGTENNWTVIDERDRTQFSGTWKQCEEWLDLRENLIKQQNRRSLFGWFTQISKMLWTTLSGSQARRLKDVPPLDTKIQRESISASSK